MTTVTDRKQARAMDLPSFSTPPFVRDIRTHAGSWGWVFPQHIAQDDAGYLWADGAASPKATAPGNSSGHCALLAWSANGLSAWVDPRGYGGLGRISGAVDETKWVPVVEVLTDLPPYADYRPDA
jgi:hypothetical protein